MKDFYPPRVNGRTSSYNPAANQPQMLNRRPSPPLPPVTASPLPKQDVLVKFPPRSDVPSNRTPNLQSSGSPPPRKSIHTQQVAPTAGKPRIFAMTAQVDDLDRQTASPPPPYVQYSAKKQPTQFTMHVQQPQPQHQPSATEWNASTNGSNSFKPVFAGSVQPPFTPKLPNHSVEQQLPPTPPSHNRGGSRSSRAVTKPDDVQHPQSSHIPQTLGTRSRKNSKSDEEPRPQSRHSSKKDSKSDEQRPQSQHTPRTPSRTRKLSKARPEVISQYSSNSTNNDLVLPSTPDSHHRSTSSVRTLTKPHPTTPVATAPKPLFGSPRSNDVPPLEPAIQLDEDTKSKAGILLDDDPFARVEGVRLLRPISSFVEKEEEKDRESIDDGGNNEKKVRDRKSSKGPSISSQNSLGSHVGSEENPSVPPVVEGGVAPPTPVSPDEHRKTRTKKKKKRHDDDSQTESTLAPPMSDNSDAIAVPSAAEEEPEEPEPEPILPLYTIIDFLSDPQLLSSLLTFFSFYDWCLLSSLSKEIRMLLVQSPALRETVLERFLKTVGYSRWVWEDPDPLLLSLQVRRLCVVSSCILKHRWGVFFSRISMIT